MTLAERYRKVTEYFSKVMPVAETELKYHNAYELTVAVILSAQCTDKRVNLITPSFFKKFPDSSSLANAEVSDIFELIKSCSYPNNKARNLSGMAKMLVNDYNSIMPSDINEMQKLPGVGRKTANVLASVLFNKNVIAVDTHVFRVSSRIGLTKNAKNPYACELQLVKYFPENILRHAHHWLLLHGRYVCIARKPKCNECGLNDICFFHQKQGRKI
jgi:endonuclease III